MSVRLLTSAMKMVQQNVLLKHTLPKSCSCQNIFYSRSVNINIDANMDKAAVENKKKTTSIPKITLIQGDELTVTSLEEAQKLSKRRDLKLVKIIDLDTKTQRPVYKLMTGSEYFAEDLKQRELKKLEKQSSTIKGEKVLILGHSISEHDLMTDVKKLLNGLQSIMRSGLLSVETAVIWRKQDRYQIEKVYGLLEESLKSTTRFLQKRQKGSDIKFQILPPKQSL
ncbi:hypothetical protein NQ317_007820 [Molorchus minor]|uniref:Translation initiation factor 3 N-terminal domain-containing protein n=1 Tax=Molorchus minor TaxID=1323400 RepID=A0ABQ9K302_9CUCU|nr:hypothetical protein NQ317_007820 [Molorchus minor]